MNPYARQILRQLEKPVIFEFGTHRAEQTWELAESDFERFYTFEPDPRNLEIINQIGLPPRVKLIPKAVGASSGKMVLYQSTNIVEAYGIWTASNSLHKPLPDIASNGSDLKFDSSVEVDVITLDEFCREEKVDSIDFIWADIQGAECDLVKGGKHMIPRTHYIFMEHEKHQTYEGQWTFDEMMATLSDFELVDRFPNDVLLMNKNWNKK